MSKYQPVYRPEFRQQMVELVQSGRSPSELSREFGCSAQTITNWVAQAAIDASRPLPGREDLTSAECAELVHLRRELRRVQQERDILAKATAWFAAKGERTSRRLRTREFEPGRRVD